MKIVFLVGSLGPGGAERVATTLCNAWAARGDTICLVSTFSGKGESFYETSAGVEVIFLADVVHTEGKTLSAYAKRLYALRCLIRERRPDVVVSFLPHVNVAAVLATAFLPTPLIICERRDPSSQPVSAPWELASKLSYRFANMLTVQTETVASGIRAARPSLRNVRVISNPLPEGVIDLTLEGNRPRKVLLSLGRLSPEKQVEKAIDAFAKLASTFTDWDLHIYGDGPLRSTLLSKIEKLGLGGRAVLKGRSNVPWQIMAGADAFVMTSRCEGFPNALLEAMGVGLPCVVFDCPSGPREISDNGVDALLVPLNQEDELLSALTTVMANEAYRQLLGNQAKEAVRRRFSLHAVLNDWDRIFEEVRGAY